MIYVARDGFVTVEKIPERYRFIDEPDGFHPVHKGAIYQDAESKREATMLIWADSIPPQAFRALPEIERTFSIESDFQRTHERKPVYSLKFWRVITDSLWNLVRWIYFAGTTTCILALLYALLLIARSMI